VQMRPRALVALRAQELEHLGRQLSDRHGLAFAPPRPGVTITGTYAHSLTTPSAKLAVITTERAVTIAPWRPALESLRGQRVQAIMHPSRVLWGRAHERS
jgi:Protein of unknown function (DUF3363)